MSVNEYVLQELARARLDEARADAAWYHLARSCAGDEMARPGRPGVLARLRALLRPAPAGPRITLPHAARR